MADPGYRMYRLANMDNEGPRPGDLAMQIGTTAFTTTLTQVSVATDLDWIEASFAIALSAADAQDAPIVGTASTEVSSDAITFTRQAAGGSATAFQYMLIGRKGTTL